MPGGSTHSCNWRGFECWSPAPMKARPVGCSPPPSRPDRSVAAEFCLPRETACVVRSRRRGPDRVRTETEAELGVRPGEAVGAVEDGSNERPEPVDASFHRTGSPRSAPTRGRSDVSETFSLGRIAGIRIGVNASVLVIVLIIGGGLAFGRFPLVLPGRSTFAYVIAALVAAV